jgi:ubiquinone/menaquinone biosynthesis C-methylase UbiE
VDLGCGVGDWALRYAEFSRRVVAVDVNAAFIDEGRARAAQCGARHVEFLRDDIARVEIPGGAELVSLGSVLQYLGDDDATRLLRRVRDGQPTGACLYVRASVAHQPDFPWASDEATYRGAPWYDRAFAESGYTVGWFGTSVRLLVHGTCGFSVPLGSIPSRRGARETRYVNWILQKP